MMTKSEIAVTKLSRDQVSVFYKIVKEELAKENIIWDGFIGRTYTYPVRRARHNVVWRLRQELKLKKTMIANLLELDESTVRLMLKAMEETSGKIPDSLKSNSRRYKPREQRA